MGLTKIHPAIANPLSQTLLDLGGYYECPKDPSGKRLGPLVGYAGKDKKGRQLVGDIYANFAKMEEYPAILNIMAQRIEESVWRAQRGITVFCGAPMGGLCFGAMLGITAEKRFVYPEKMIIELATPTSREKSKMIWNRHGIDKGDRVAICEDVLNNFSTTDQLDDLIREAGGETVAIVGILNRSLEVENEYRLKSGATVPVISLVRKPIMQWEQDDPAVADDIKAGNVILKPKDQWPKLMAAMEVHPK